MAKPSMKAFEKSKFDVEKPGIKEGSKEDKALDKKQFGQMKKSMGFKRGGRARGR
jgi:hypothetical protein